jgi:DNA-binding transcriptional MerR regulator
LPEKVYYKIGEVADAAGLRTSVLRFWESEFSFLKPAKSSTGQRLYSKNEVELVLQVKRLLYEDKFTIEGVKKRFSVKGRMLKPEDQIVEKVVATDFSDVLKQVKNDLKVLRDLL